VIVVDANDSQIGTASKLEAHRSGLRHRAISVIIGDRDGRVLLHRRAAGKYHSGGLWTNTCCSHPRPGEPASDAATRRLVEEMGISCPLTFVFSMNYRAEVSNGLVEDEIVHVFGGRFDGTPIPDPLEVSDWAGNRLAKSSGTSTRGPTSIPFGSERSATNSGATLSRRFLTAAQVASRCLPRPDLLTI
jgi:isopentenyl-diphosphate delta-isomerase